MTDMSRLAADLATDEATLVARLAEHQDAAEASARAVKSGASLVQAIRSEDDPGLMEVFLAEYGLSTEEGIALMCLAEALLRVPDTDTIDALIEDKIAPSAWNTHLGHSTSPLVNASTWALMLTGRVLAEPAQSGVASTMRRAVKRLGEPVIRTAVARAMKEMGRQFVLGTDIHKAMDRAAGMEAKGYTYSYDMLGEAARTDADAVTYFHAYEDAIAAIAGRADPTGDVRANPGISIKLSALHPRYEHTHRDTVMAELLPRAAALALAARRAGIGLNIDAEEADRLEISLDVIEALLSEPQLAGWDGFGIVVQAYGKRALAVIDHLDALARRLDRRIMVRLVKGAYWDTEIKRAQVEGLPGYPVFTSKAATDVNYMVCAERLLSLTDRIYPQFATHNAHTICAILEMGADPNSFEFQRLHGMGEALHNRVKKTHGTRCRIYAPVGRHRDLLAYLVRRLLENGANSSFVNQILDENIPAEEVTGDPFTKIGGPSPLPLPPALYGSSRVNSRGRDLHDSADLAELGGARNSFADTHWDAAPLMAAPFAGGETHVVTPPQAPDAAPVGRWQAATAEDVSAAISAAQTWDNTPARKRGDILRAAADAYEAHEGEFHALLCREAGKTWLDAVAEIREAVDFLRYYAVEAEKLTSAPRGIVTCISPWNFPLAIFTGQIAAALAAGNAVVAKPAETTVLTAHLATRVMLEAGVPATALQLLPGHGHDVGAALTAAPEVRGVAFTGSTATAQRINRNMAEHMAPGTPLIAETGGLNAMIVDSSALPEQAVRDIVASSFQSAGQRCSALRMLYLQEDVAPRVLRMLYGAMDALVIGDPGDPATDVGPVINAAARDNIQGYIDAAAAEGRVLKTMSIPEDGYFIAPTVLEVKGIEEMEREVFGPVLHVATFRASEIDAVVDAINATGFGLTFGIHSRIDDRVDQVTGRLKVGNIYVNRNQIGAIVGSQPFGGWGLSGTGPKAGGPAYLPRFSGRVAWSSSRAPEGAKVANADAVQTALDALPATPMRPLSSEVLPGPTGESNRLSVFPRGPVLCLGPDAGAARAQAAAAARMQCPALMVAPGLKKGEGVNGSLPAEALATLNGFALVAFDGTESEARELARALAARDGAILPLVQTEALTSRAVVEQHLCIDTTAAGGNAALLADVE